MSTILKTYTLTQQTPLIHFQYDQSGATLRATEVKPKLDRFLIRKLGDGLKKSWLIKDTESLNYKLRFYCPAFRTVELGRGTDFDIYYGNLGENQKKGVIADSVTMTVVCFIEELQQAIDENIKEFFAVTNFGTMQNKGFGSYLIEGTDISLLPKWLKAACGATACYSFNGKQQPFVEIKKVYSIMKSGINANGYQRSLLFLYMHETQSYTRRLPKQNIDNEKAQLKQTGLAPAIAKNAGNLARTDLRNTNPRYVRALLGVGDHIDFLNAPAAWHDKTEVKISSKEIERLESCIFFKVLKAQNDSYTVYFTAKRIHEEIYGKQFTFRAKTKKDRKAPPAPAFVPAPGPITMTVPKQNELPADFIDDFLRYCVSKFNDPNNGVNARLTVSIREVR